MVNPRNCQHQNIHWEDFFKLPKKNKAYCVDCGDNKSKLFTKNVQKWYCKKIENWLKDNNLTTELNGNYSFGEFTIFLSTNNYVGYWYKLRSGKIEEEFGNVLGGQILFWEVCKSIEYLCLEFKKEKQNNPNTPPRKSKEKTRERERANSARY